MVPEVRVAAMSSEKTLQCDCHTRCCNPPDPSVSSHGALSELSLTFFASGKGFSVFAKAWRLAHSSMLSLFVT
jgi:hypothetical protein